MPYQFQPDILALTVLALLSEQPRHPYDLQRLIRERHKEFAAQKERGLYHAVNRLAARGLIEPLETSREGRRPERTIYRITERGSEEFETRLRDLLENPRAEHPAFSAAVSFLSYLSKSSAREALQARTVALEAHIAGLTASLRVLQSDLGLPRLFLLEHELGQALLAAELGWVRGLIDDVNAGRLAWDPASLGQLFAGYN